jgi:hypothetical protein
MAIQRSYPAARSTGRCAATGREFAPGERIVAALVERESGGLERRDYALDAWEGGARPTPPDVVFGFWRTTYTAEEKRRDALLSDDELLDLFDDLVEEQEGKSQAAFRYFLALLLVRRRRLRLVGMRDGAMLVLRKGETGEPIRVPDPGLSDESIAEAMEQLGRIIAPESDGGAP